MSNDEQEIRDLIATWMAATRNNELEKVLSLMADDAVFLMPGQQPVRKADFAAAARAQVGRPSAQIDTASDIQEIKVLGDWAYIWSLLTVTVTAGVQSVKRAGPTMTVLKKEDGRWLLARDANMLVTVAS